MDLLPDRPPPMTGEEYCEFRKISKGAAAQERYKGTGPTFIKANGRIYYDPTDVYAWLDANKKQRTDDTRITQRSNRTGDRPGAA